MFPKNNEYFHKLVYGKKQNNNANIQRTVTSNDK